MALLTSFLQYFTDTSSKSEPSPVDMAKLVQEIHTELQKLADENTELKQLLAGVSKENADLLLRLNSIADHVGSLNESIDASNAEVNYIKVEMDECKSELDSHLKVIHHIRNGASDMKNQMKGLKTSNAAIKRNNADLQQQMNELKVLTNSIQQQVISSSTSCLDSADL